MTRPSGAAFLWELRALGCDGDDVLPICIGDHLTDEDAFRALVGRGISIVVLDEPRDSHAVYTLRDPDQVGAFLDALATSLADR